MDFNLVTALHNGPFQALPALETLEYLTLSSLARTKVLMENSMHWPLVRHALPTIKKNLITQQAAHIPSCEVMNSIMHSINSRNHAPNMLLCTSRSICILFTYVSIAHNVMFCDL